MIDEESTSAAVGTWPTLRIFPERRSSRLDPVVIEEPLEIVVNGTSWVVTLRSPGDDRRLVLGLLYSEGLLRTLDELISLEAVAKPGRQANRVEAELGGEERVSVSARALISNSACGLCGSRSIERLALTFPRVLRSAPLRLEQLIHAPRSLRSRQRLFQLTGGIHAASLIDLTGGKVLLSAEDVGRHNAVDKVIGGAVLKGYERRPGLLLATSSRVGFEIVAKAWALGVEVIVALGAPTTLALETAEAAGICVCGFATGERVNVYTFAERLEG